LRYISCESRHVKREVRLAKRERAYSLSGNHQLLAEKH
jgi:hypothetical protein